MRTLLLTLAILIPQPKPLENGLLDDGPALEVVRTRPAPEQARWVAERAQDGSLSMLVGSLGKESRWVVPLLAPHLGRLQGASAPTALAALPKETAGLLTQYVRTHPDGPAAESFAVELGKHGYAQDPEVQGVLYAACARPPWDAWRILVHPELRPDVPRMSALPLFADGNPMPVTRVGHVCTPSVLERFVVAGDLITKVNDAPVDWQSYIPTGLLPRHPTIVRQAQVLEVHVVQERCFDGRSVQTVYHVGPAAKDIKKLGADLQCEGCGLCF